MQMSEAPEPTGLPEAVGWTMLLAQGVELAKATRALPQDATGERWRDTVGPLVTCQAIRYALGLVEHLEVSERPLARDLAAVSLRDAATSLDALWRGESMPEAVLAVVEEAERAWRRSAYAGLRTLELREESEPWWVPVDRGLQQLEAESSGRVTAAAMAPGTLALPGSPLAWWTGCGDPPFETIVLERCRIRSGQGPVQVYRQLDEQGRMLGDLVADLDSLPAGMPLLVPLRFDGEAIATPPYPEESWRAMQERSLDGRDPRTLELRFELAAGTEREAERGEGADST